MSESYSQGLTRCEDCPLQVAANEPLLNEFLNGGTVHGVALEGTLVLKRAITEFTQNLKLL